MCTKLYTDASREDMGCLAKLIANKDAEEQLVWGDIRPTDSTPILVQDGFHTSVVAGMWGYLNENGQTTYVNARTETVALQRRFSADLLTHRCVIPVTGYYVSSARDKSDRLYFDKAGNLLFLAGIWHKDYQGNYRFVILTAKADGNPSPLAPRMPLLLDSDFVKTWLSDPQAARDCLSSEMPSLSYLQIEKTSA